MEIDGRLVHFLGRWLEVGQDRTAVLRGFRE